MKLHPDWTTILFPGWENDPLDLILPDIPEAPGRDTSEGYTERTDEELSPELPDRDEWELHHKHIFDDFDRYYYYCEFVDGYVEAHGLRGIKERNEQYLKELRESNDHDRDIAIIWKLVENNRPLARREAMRMFSINRWTEEDLRDAYEDSLLLLAQRYIKKLDELRNYNIKQLQYLNFYTFRWACFNYAMDLRRRMEAGLWECEPLDEENPNIVRENYLNVDTRELTRFSKIFNRRNRYILLTYIYGDRLKNILSYYQSPNASEAIGWEVGVTRTCVNQNIQKMFKTFRKYNNRLKIRERVFFTSENYLFEMEQNRKIKTD